MANYNQVEAATPDQITNGGGEPTTTITDAEAAAKTTEEGE